MKYYKLLIEIISTAFCFLTFRIKDIMPLMAFQWSNEVQIWGNSRRENKILGLDYCSRILPLWRSYLAWGSEAYVYRKPTWREWMVTKERKVERDYETNCLLKLAQDCSLLKCLNVWVFKKLHSNIRKRIFIWFLMFKHFKHNKNVYKSIRSYYVWF